MSHIAKNNYTVDTDNEYVTIEHETVNSKISYLKSMDIFLEKLNANPIDEDSTEKLQFLIRNKAKINKLEKALKEKGRKGVLATMQEFLGEDQEVIASKTSEFLLYSRTIAVESVLELIGDKRDPMLLKQYMKRFEPLLFNQNIEKGLRELFTSFRLAGVESQTVERVLEAFGHFYYEFYQSFTTEDGILKFANKQECYEFVYLLIMLHTCHHNPNLENKTSFKWFLDSLRELCKESHSIMDEKILLEMFHSIEVTEFDSPLSRNLYDKKFTIESLPIELYIRTQIRSVDTPIETESSYVN